MYPTFRLAYPTFIIQNHITWDCFGNNLEASKVVVGYTEILPYNALERLLETTSL